MIYELRIYHCTPGCLPKVLDRFQNIVFGFWEKYEIKQVGFWTTLIGESNMDVTYLLGVELTRRKRREVECISSRPRMD